LSKPASICFSGPKEVCDPGVTEGQFCLARLRVYHADHAELSGGDG
jgi:hypothetical protein